MSSAEDFVYAQLRVACYQNEMITMLALGDVDNLRDFYSAYLEAVDKVQMQIHDMFPMYGTKKFFNCSVDSTIKQFEALLKGDPNASNSH